MKKKLTVLALSLMTAFSFFGVVASTIAWFSAGTHINFGDDPGNVDVSGGSNGSYYESGDGTSEHPFIISDKIHLYNLAWLQYIGFYNSYKTTFQDHAPSDIVQCYFKLKNNIDMGGMTLPPIGTEIYPFLGNFNGQGYTVSNFTISNDDPKNASSDFGVAKPANLYGGTVPDVVGFFGVVGKLPTQAITYDTSVVSISNVKLKDFTVKSKTNQTLIGLAAGYVDGAMSGVKIDGEATLDINGTTNKTAKTTITGVTELTHYGLVGYTTQETNRGNSYSQDLSEYYHTGNAGGGTDNTWGGSFNFQEFNSRFYYHLNNSSITIPDLSNGQSDSNLRYRNYLRYYDGASDFKFSLYRNSGSETSAKKNSVNNAEYAKNPDSNAVVYNMTGNYSGSWKTATSGSMSGTATINIPGTIQPLIINNDYSTSAKNTGYIIGGHKLGTGTNGQNNMIPYLISASYPIRYLNNSTNDTVISDANVQSGSGTFVGYDKTKLEILTPKKNANYSTSNYVLIKDELSGYNSTHEVINTNMDDYTKDNTTTPTALGLTKYNDSRVNLHKILANVNQDGTYTSKSFVHGMHFRGNASDEASVYINNTTTFTASNVKINSDTPISSYKFPTSCIDFNLATEGKINMFAGSYYYANTNGINTTDSFMSLWEVTRTSNTDFTVKQIKRIFKKNDENASPKYVYDYTGSTTPAASTLVFDVAFLNKPMPVKNALYYFELPVNAGEYAIGTADKSAGGAYLMYLDIGTSGEKTNEVSAYSIITKSTGYTFPVGVDFAVVNAGTSGGDSFGVSIPTGKKGFVSFAISSTEIDVGGTTESTYSMSKYAFQGTCFSEQAAQNKFTVGTTSPPQPLQTLSTGGQRILYIQLKLVGTGGASDNSYDIRVIDDLDTGGNILSSSYKLDSGSGLVDSDYSTINGLGSSSGRFTIDPSSNDSNNLRKLAKVVTLTRSNGSTGAFVTSYNTTNCDYKTKIIDVHIVTNGATIEIGTITSGYTFKIDGTAKSTGQTYS